MGDHIKTFNALTWGSIADVFNESGRNPMGNLCVGTKFNRKSVFTCWRPFHIERRVSLHTSLCTVYFPYLFIFFFTTSSYSICCFPPWHTFSTYATKKQICFQRKFFSSAHIKTWENDCFFQVLSSCPLPCLLSFTLQVFQTISRLLCRRPTCSDTYLLNTFKLLSFYMQFDTVCTHTK